VKTLILTKESEDLQNLSQGDSKAIDSYGL